MTLRVALVGGPMYDHLYDVFDDAGLDVEVVVHADHPTLNRAVADMLGRGERLDLISTHSKYAPSQQEWLLPLDGMVDAGGLAPLAVNLCRFDGRLLCLPRLIDVRILWYRRDRLDAPPDTWQDVLDRRVAFGFPGRESGLFGTFFELVVGAGGRLFDGDGSPRMDSPDALAAAALLAALAARGPDDLPGWHYDQVDAALLDGRGDAAGVWPGGWGPIRDAPGGSAATALWPALYPAGPARRVSYSGCHAWAIPTTCADVPAATALLTRLVGGEANSLDAAGGSICAHVDVFAAVEPRDERDALRLQLTAETIRTAMITYPPHPRFPEVEDAGWQQLHDVLRGEVGAAQAVRRIQEVAEVALAV